MKTEEINNVKLLILKLLDGNEIGVSIDNIIDFMDKSVYSFKQISPILNNLISEKIIILKDNKYLKI